jgi:tetratricopeptide (TPR) repeat protein
MVRTLVTTGLLTFGLVLSAHAQGKGGGSSGGGPPSNPNAEMTSGVGKYANWDQLAAHQRGSLYFSGRVVVGAGTLPWDPIPVIVTCNGVVRYDTHTDSKGTFEIEAAAKESEVAPGQPASNRLTPAQLIGCTVNASLEGFQSTPLTIQNRSIVDNPDIGTISLHLDEKATGFAVSTTSASATKDAQKDYDKARSEASNRHLDSAQHDLEKAVQAYPQYAEAWYQLGKIDEVLKPQDALAAYSKAAAADPLFSPPYEHIAALAAQQQKWQEVVDATDHALKLDPAGTPAIWYLSAVGNYNLGNRTVAEANANTSLAMDPSHVSPNTEQLLAVMLAAKGNYAGALMHLRNCLSYSPPGPNADLMKQQVAQLQKLVPPASK